MTELSNKVRPVRRLGDSMTGCEHGSLRGPGAQGSRDMQDAGTYNDARDIRRGDGIGGDSPWCGDARVAIQGFVPLLLSSLPAQDDSDTGDAIGVTALVLVAWCGRDCREYACPSRYSLLQEPDLIDEARDGTISTFALTLLAGKRPASVGFVFWAAVAPESPSVLPGSPCGIVLRTRIAPQPPCIGTHSCHGTNQQPKMVDKVRDDSASQVEVSYRIGYVGTPKGLPPRWCTTLATCGSKPVARPGRHLAVGNEGCCMPAGRRY
ncbi:hypothetical protein FOMPIDRAFT_94731 [Fomitopsis schrenkii]|uniref:Uncharacterized protein n=1 Tax=Fomitopsis schrenkii TaxID=2126942 RepID=S8F1C0_FOMSC|nr:hypothetical protein FOMPIDRAFT_94731 [Fomitopsis schrenkii]